METQIKVIGKRILISWLLASGLFVAVTAFFVLRDGPRFMLTIMGTGDGTPHLYRFIIFWIGWFWIGLILCLSQFTEFSKRHWLFCGVLVLLGFLYLNQIREPYMTGVGDFPVYYEAAVTMSKGEPIEGREQAQLTTGSELKPGELYIYPPLLATILSPFVSFGQDTLVNVYHLFNYWAVIMLAVLLYGILPRFKYSREMAAVSIFVIMAVNVPIMRTLAYHQINIFVLDFILLCLLFYPRSSFLSALSLSLAIHLKVYPVILVIPFIFRKDWRWLGWFVVSQFLIVVTTSLITSPSYYLDFIRQLNSLAETGLRNSSVSSFLYNTFRIFRIGNPTIQLTFSYLIRLVLLILFAIPSVRIIRKGLASDDLKKQSLVLNSFALLPIAMLIISPSIWEHHYVLIILSTLVIFTQLRSATEIWMFVLAYAFIFLLPIVELYPFSYLPLLALILFIVLLWMIARHMDEIEPGWFSRLKVGSDPFSTNHD